MDSDAAPLSEPTGQRVLAHATSKEYCVIEFSETDDGDMVVKDITDHVKALEEDGP